jgi:4-hydroxy-4-methyl-2-oxoglutarate aldolase
MYGKIITDPPRPSEALLKKFEGLWTSTISDVMGRHGVLSPDIKPLFTPITLIGAAFTVLNYPNDNVTTHRALQMARKGDVLVIDEGLDNFTGAFGHNMSLNARAQGVVGLVSSGHVRDARLLREEQFPVFSKGVCPRSAQKNHPGSINGPVSIGGIVVNPGDLAIGDDDGVCIVPLAYAEEVLEKASERQRMELDQADGIRNGDQALGILYGDNWAKNRTAETLEVLKKEP